MKFPTFLPFILLPYALSLPLSNDTTTAPSEINSPCNFDLGDCASPLTCIPLSTTCTRWASLQDSWPGCPGTCQLIDVSDQKVYTKCAGWGFYDNCDERVEYCREDPRNDDCGPPCDGAGICQPNDDYCGGKEKQQCREGLACFVSPSVGQVDQENPFGVCLPLRFGSERYEKTRLEESWTEEWDGWQKEEP
ncbi:hypothetical protein QBC36DRAFT_341191 [Triangularia setosa]|uniref:Uncharacterized protein n=1 Tax=Triangularia setosa TaxID=2587417 RepID=A0AAN7A2E2_9PEZI|nr:hypothetical protein QBC36DRAFT_341191 [Podospora setosa]